MWQSHLKDKVLVDICHNCRLCCCRTTKGKDTSDGTFRKEQRFKCADDCGVFVHVGRLSLCSEPGKFADSYSTLRSEQSSKHVSPVQHPDVDIPSPVELSSDAGSAHRPSSPPQELTPPPLDLGERVVWISDHGPESGVAKWIGSLPDSEKREWTVGVEFVSIPWTHVLCTPQRLCPTDIYIRLFLAQCSMSQNAVQEFFDNSGQQYKQLSRTTKKFKFECDKHKSKWAKDAH